MPEVVLLLQAELDIQDLYIRFEEFSEGYGDRFSVHFEAALEHLALHPYLGKRHNLKYRRLLVDQFPIGIFYSVSGDRVLVAGVADLRQDPAAIERRLP